MTFKNVYDDERLAAAYSQLEFPGTYWLAFRDLPEIVSEAVRGRRALDFGCGTGRSTRFLRGLGFDVVGVDISDRMLQQARSIDPKGDYRLIDGADFRPVRDEAPFDLILAAFTFDNIATVETKVELLRSLGGLLAPRGRAINLVSSPQIYLHEWTSFSTVDFPENRNAKAGDIVRIINTAIADRRPCEDILWTGEAWRDVYARADLQIVRTHEPLGHAGEPHAWVNETRIAPWVIYVLERIPNDPAVRRTVHGEP